MGNGPPITAIAAGDPVVAEDVYGNDQALQQFVKSLPNDNLEKPYAAAVISLSCSDPITANGTYYRMFSKGGIISDEAPTMKNATASVRANVSGDWGGGLVVAMDIYRSSDAWASKTLVHSFGNIAAASGTAHANDNAIKTIRESVAGKTIAANDDICVEVVVSGISGGEIAKEMWVSFTLVARHQE